MLQIDLKNPVVRSYLFYVCMLVAKTMLMTLLTLLTRIRKKALISEEDQKFASFFVGNDVKVVNDDPDVERVRRAHLNDLENIPLLIIIGFVYVLTQPDEWLAINLFRLCTLFRFLHTAVYAIIPIPQPTRMICFTIPYLIASYMLFAGISTFFSN